MAATNPASSSSLGFNTQGNLTVNPTNWAAWLVGGLLVIFGAIWLVKRKRK